MSWFNFYGLAIMILLMIPNIFYSLQSENVFDNYFDCKALEIAEQIGRYGSFILMVFNIPTTYFGWLFQSAETIYVIVNCILIVAYELIWLIMRNNNKLARAILLSTIPSVIFVFSGISLLSIPLILFSLLFAVCHITISIKNASFIDNSSKRVDR